PHILLDYYLSHPSYLHSFPTRRSSDLLHFRRQHLAHVERHESDRDDRRDVPAVRGPSGANAIKPAGARMTFNNEERALFGRLAEDRKSTRLNSSHEWISYAVFCLKKKK